MALSGDAAAAAGLQRFPVDVEQLALHVGQELKWPDPIFKVVAADIPSFMDWAISSDKARARANGAFYKTKSRVVELPAGSTSANAAIASCRIGDQISLNTWFEHAHRDAVAREMKLVC